MEHSKSKWKVTLMLCALCTPRSWKALTGLPDLDEDERAMLFTGLPSELIVYRAIGSWGRPPTVVCMQEREASTGSVTHGRGFHGAAVLLQATPQAPGSSP